MRSFWLYTSAAINKIFKHWLIKQHLGCGLFKGKSPFNNTQDFFYILNFDFETLSTLCVFSNLCWWLLFEVFSTYY